MVDLYWLLVPSARSLRRPCRAEQGFDLAVVGVIEGSLATGFLHSKMFHPISRQPPSASALFGLTPTVAPTVASTTGPTLGLGVIMRISFPH